MEFEGEFETHLTVRAGDAAGFAAMQTWATLHDLNVLHIVLDRGESPIQPMVSCRTSGWLSQQITAAIVLAEELTSLGLGVVRTKIEAAPWNRDVPASDAEAETRHAGRYFEHHVKLALDLWADVAALISLSGRHAAHLSRNTRRERADGLLERFVTQRCHLVGRATARRRLDELLAALAVAGHKPVSVEEEFVVYDSNLGLDAGWLDVAPGDLSPAN